MTLSEVKKLFKTTTTKVWIEAGVNVITIGDKMVTPDKRFSRLDYYAKDNKLKFCSYDKCVVPCGEITFMNGKKIFYNISKN